MDFCPFGNGSSDFTRRMCEEQEWIKQANYNWKENECQYIKVEICYW